jgi:hypothetical protein
MIHLQAENTQNDRQAVNTERGESKNPLTS